jgi:hypothetical protein
MLVTACRTVRSEKEIAIRPVEVISISPTYKNNGEADLAVAVEVHNPGSSVGRANRIEWRVWLDQKLFAQGEQFIAQPLQASANTRFEVVLPLALRRPAGAGELAPVELSIRGTIAALIAGSEEELPFAHDVTVRAPSNRLPSADEE